MSLILGRSRTQCVAMVTKVLSANCGAHLVESYCKESNISDTNWQRYPFSSNLIKMWSVWRHHLANLNISGTKRYFKIVNRVFLLMQATYLCFKMASIEKMQFSS